MIHAAPRSYYLASKCGCVVGGAQGEHVHTAANIRHGVENSLRLLRTDHLDLVQFHRSLTPAEFEREGGLQEALKLKAEGKVRFLGVSGTLPNLVPQIQLGVFDAFQIPYSALQREHEAVISKAARAGAGTIIRGGVNVRAAKLGALPENVVAEAKRRLSAAGATVENV